ncbi:nucleolar protein 12 [Cimex lectularius]|uniref:Nucleolar protein 12 n=1 Tax=Cimex lectularius TaxID=79782 RepID=A0A8I6SKJ9_CIMLE|nr:nucleolar protein 12 [Cimex lectularius]
MDFGEDDEENSIVTARRRKKRINRKTKLHIVFDEEARREFLTGFRKRKQHRRMAAQEELKNQLKAEKKRIKSEAKEQYKKLVHSYKPIPELEEQFAQEFDVDDAKVSVLELDTDLLAKTNFLIGRNRGSEMVKIEKEDPESKGEEEEGVPGMEIKTKKDIQRAMKQSTINSKVFQRKNRIEQLKQKKKSMRQKKETMKIKAKCKKRKKGHLKSKNKSRK